MPTIPLDLDGVTEIPAGKIATVVTYLEMNGPRPARPALARPGLILRRVRRPDLGWYRDLFRRIGEDWLWFSRLVMRDGALEAALADPDVEIHVLERDGTALGMVEFDLSALDEAAIQILYFGLVPDAVGDGLGRFMMQETLALAFRPGVGRVWLHTCTLDHPAALGFYRREGFTAYKLAVEVADDPRLAGYMPRAAAPRVPIVE